MTINKATRSNSIREDYKGLYDLSFKNIRSVLRRWRIFLPNLLDTLLVEGKGERQRETERDKERQRQRQRQRQREELQS